MKILHYIPTYAPAWQFGGPVRSVSNLCEGLAELGHDVTVFTTNAGLTANADIRTDCPIRRNGVTVHYFDSTVGLMGINSVQMENAVTCRLSEFNVLHITGVWQPTSRVACRIACRLGIPYVYSPRGALGRYSFTQKRWKKFLYYWIFERSNLQRASAIHYTAVAEQRECERLQLNPPAFIIHNSLDIGAWRPDSIGAKSWRQDNGLSEDELVFLYAGRLHHKKGLEILAKVAAGLPVDRRWRFALVGFDEDGTGQRLLMAFRQLGLENRLILAPVVESTRLAMIYSAADLFVFPSRNENFGNVAIEALACGCPVALSDNVGAASVLSGIPGVNILPNDASAWGQCLGNWFGKSPKCRPPVEQIRKLFSRTEVAGKMEAVYKDLLK